MNVKIKQLMFSFIGGTSEQEIEFQNKLNGFRLQVDSYGDTLSAKMRLQYFVSNFIKNLSGFGETEDNQLKFNILKSTVPENGDFLKLDFQQVGNENQSDTTIDVTTEHMDLFFVKNVFKDL